MLISSKKNKYSFPKYIIKDYELSSDYLHKGTHNGNDMNKWYWYARNKLFLNNETTKKLLILQENEVLNYLQRNIDDLYKLAKPLYDTNTISNKEIVSIYKIRY